MIATPFSLFRQFDDRLQIALFTKSDDIQSDTDAAKCLHVQSATGLHQMHGKRTVIIRTSSNRTEEADGMITDTPDLALCCRSADCQNFVVYAPEHGVVGALHVGWRGVVAGAIPEFFAVMKREWGILPSQTFVGAGPSLCQKCAEFSDPKNELPSLSPTFIDGKCVNLQGAATQQFLDCGVEPGHIERHPDCTRCHPETYWTYRGGDLEAVKQGHTNMLACALRRE